MSVCSSVVFLSPVHRSCVYSCVCRWSIVGLSLVCCWSVTGLLLVCSGHGRWSWSLIVHPSCIARASLVCLFLFLLVCCSSVVGHDRCFACCSPVAPPACPSLACLLVRCFPVCCSFTSLSARAMVAGSSLVHLLPVAAPSTGVVTGPSLVCPLVRHSSI